jgi:ankyrin repeat protein
MKPEAVSDLLCHNGVVATEQKEIVQLPVDKNADINARNQNGLVNLSFSKEKGHKEIVELLHKLGAK